MKDYKLVTQTNIPELKLLSRGKVRDIYEVDDDKLLLITTDRMSAFDVILGDPIKNKGAILNLMSIFWQNKFQDIVQNHILEYDPKKYPAVLHKYFDDLDGRSVLVKKAKALPVECIVRGYITGSGWKDYQKSGRVCGYTLAKNLQESQMLDEPLFTPSTKAELGAHDENIDFATACKILGTDLAEQVRDVSLKIYKSARDYAKERGIIIADTKFEFGLVDNKLTLIDEVLTPDSSRFWSLNNYQLGKSQASFDKQYLRDWLETQDWNKTPPAPKLPQEIMDTTSQKYQEAYTILTTSASVTLDPINKRNIL